MARVCLNMIVKDEAHVIRRCLDNIGHLVDAIAIVDTGSTDNTIAIMEAFMQERKLPGKIIQRPWVDFGHNRTEALRHGEDVVKGLVTQGHPGPWYFFFMDADDLAYAYDEKGVDRKQPFRLGAKQRAKMNADAYTVELRSGAISYGRTLFVRYNPEKQWKWFCPAHEYVGENPPGSWKAVFGQIKGNFVYSLREGARSKDPLKYLRDAMAFEKALKEDPKNDRCLYYRAQSYKDAGLPDLAEKYYRLRATGPNNEWRWWNDEYTYLAYVEAAKIRIERGDRDHETRDLLEKAFEKRPGRLEAPYWLIFLLRMQEKYVQGWILAKSLLALPYTTDNIFVDTDIHTWRFLDEAALCAYYANDKVAYAELSQKVLACPRTPADVKTRIENNLKTFPPATKPTLVPVTPTEVKTNPVRARLKAKLAAKTSNDPPAEPKKKKKGLAGASKPLTHLDNSAQPREATVGPVGNANPNPPTTLGSTESGTATNLAGSAHTPPS